MIADDRTFPTAFLNIRSVGFVSFFLEHHLVIFAEQRRFSSHAVGAVAVGCGLREQLTFFGENFYRHAFHRLVAGSDCSANLQIARAGKQAERKQEQQAKISNTHNLKLETGIYRDFCHEEIFFTGFHAPFSQW